MFSSVLPFKSSRNIALRYFKTLSRFRLMDFPLVFFLQTASQPVDDLMRRSFQQSIVYHLRIKVEIHNISHRLIKHLLAHLFRLPVRTAPPPIKLTPKPIAPLANSFRASKYNLWRSSHKFIHQS